MYLTTVVFLKILVTQPRGSAFVGIFADKKCRYSKYFFGKTAFLYVSIKERLYDCGELFIGNDW